MNKGRIEAFSDGVMAVAITLLALDLHVPDPAGRGSLAHRLGEQWPNYAAYIVSFGTIGIIWINHDAMLRRLVTVDHTILVLNLVLLLTVGVLPFSTALMAEYLKVANGQNLADVIYGGSFLAMALAFFAMQRHLLLAKQHLLRDHLTPDRRRVVLRRNAVGLMPYAVATPAGVSESLPHTSDLRCRGRVLRAARDDIRRSATSGTSGHGATCVMCSGGAQGAAAPSGRWPRFFWDLRWHEHSARSACPLICAWSRLPRWSPVC